MTAVLCWGCRHEIERGQCWVEIRRMFPPDWTRPRVVIYHPECRVDSSIRVMWSSQVDALGGWEAACYGDDQHEETETVSVDCPECDEPPVSYLLTPDGDYFVCDLGHEWQLPHSVFYFPGDE